MWGDHKKHKEISKKNKMTANLLYLLGILVWLMHWSHYSLLNIVKGPPESPPKGYTYKKLNAIYLVDFISE